MSKISIKKLEDIEVNILKGLFPYVRLLDAAGGVIVSAKKTRGNAERIRAHWNFIRQKIEYELPDGEYIIECAYDAARKNVHQYFYIKEPGFVPAPKPVELHKPTVKMDKDYIETIKENAQLSATNTFLIQQNELLSRRISELEAALEEATEEAEEKELSEAPNQMVTGLKEIWAQAAPMLDHYFALRNRELELKYKNPQQSPGEKKIPRKVPVSNPANSALYKQQFDTLNALFESNDENKINEANAILDQLSVQNLPLYNQLIKDLNLEENE